MAIENGSIDGDRVKFSIKVPNMTREFDLKASGDVINGEVHAKRDSGETQSLKVALKREK